MHEVSASQPSEVCGFVCRWSSDSVTYMDLPPRPSHLSYEKLGVACLVTRVELDFFEVHSRKCIFINIDVGSEEPCGVCGLTSLLAWCD